MTAHITNLHCRYRVYGERALSARVSARLDGIGREKLATSYEQALSQLLDQNSKVILLRRIDARLTIALQKYNTDTQIANQWGKNLAIAVVQAISNSNPSGGNLIIFENQAEYITSFIIHALKDQAWQHWYYGAFRYLQGRELASAMHDVLMDNREHLSQVLTRLYQSKALPRLLTQLNRQSMQSLWLNGVALKSEFTPPSQVVTQEQALALMRSWVDEGLMTWPEGELDVDDLSNIQRVLEKRPWLDARKILALLAVYFAQSTQFKSTKNDVSLSANVLPKDYVDILSSVFFLVTQLALWSDRAPSQDQLFHDFQLSVDIDYNEIEAINNAFCHILQSLSNKGFLKKTSQDTAAKLLADLALVLQKYPWLDKGKVQATLMSVYDLQEPSIHKLTPSSTESEQQLNSTAFFTEDKDNSLFISAFNLMEQLNLWRQNSPSQQQLFNAYQARTLLDWRDRDALNNSFCDILRYFSVQGYIKSFGRHVPPNFLPDLDQALKRYDWLDVAKIRDTLLAILSDQLAQGTEQQNYSLTPRQQELIDNLHAVFAQLPKSDLVEHYNNTEALSLTLYAALVERFPRWSQDNLAIRLIASLAQAVQISPYAKTETSIIWQTGQAKLQQVHSQLPAHTSKQSREAIAFLRSLGEPAQTLLNVLTETEELVNIDTSVIESRCAGVFLLLRTYMDMRLPALLKGVAYPVNEDDYANFIIPLFLRIAGDEAIIDNRIDPGLEIFSGNSPKPSIALLKTAWAETTSAAHLDFLTALLTMLSGQRLLKDDQLNIYTWPNDGSTINGFVIGDVSGHLWPLGAIASDVNTRKDQLTKSLLHWIDVKGRPPQMIIVDETLAPDCRSALSHFDTKIVAVPPSTVDSPLTEEEEKTFHQGRENLRTVMQDLSSGKLGLTNTDFQFALITVAVLRAWARWLPRLSQSSVGYLLKKFIHRAGRIMVGSSEVIVELEAAPLDVVVEMAGYTKPLENVPYLGGRKLIFQIRR